MSFYFFGIDYTILNSFYFIFFVIASFKLRFEK